jgi:hypothetical protein
MAQRSFIQKTLQPLQKKIPLYVKSFINPLLTGTSVSKGVDLEPYLPLLLKKPTLISLSSIDFPLLWKKTSARFCLVSSIQNKSKLNTEFHKFLCLC